LLPENWQIVDDASQPNQLLGNLFAVPNAPTRQHSNTPISVAIESAADPLAEAEWAVRGVLSDLESGLAPNQVAIYSRDPETYVPLVEAAALRFGLPLSSSRRLPLLGNSFARLMLDVLDFCAGDDVRAIGKVLRSSYLGLSEEEREPIYESAKEAFRTGDQQWAEFATFAKTKDIKWLLELLEWRKESLRDAARLTVWIDRIRDLGQQPWHESAIEKTSSTASRDGYAQSALQRTLAQYATIEQARGGRRYTLPQFARFCRRIWEEAQVSTPSTLGAVSMVSSTQELGPVAALYVLGMLEGVFPRRRSEDPILTDSERALISQRLGLKHALANSHTKAFAEREEFYRLCGAATSKLLLSYPETDDDRDNVPAFYLTEVERAMDGVVLKNNHRRSQLTPADPSIEADKSLAFALEAEREKPLPNVLNTPDAVSAVSQAAKQALSISDLSDILECPFHYLAARNLDLHPNRRRSRWHHLYRLPSVTGLATHPSREEAQRALEAQLESEAGRLFPEAAPHDLALIRSGGKRLISEWLDREFSSRELWPREAIIDQPAFDRGDLKSKLKGDDGFVFLKGSFPALSTREGYRILHLFKASEPWDDNLTREEDPWFRLKPKSAFEIGLLLLSLGGATGNVGIEIDSSSGFRNLFVTPRPDRVFPGNLQNGFRVTVIDRDRSKDIFANVGKDVRKALNRISSAQVEPIAGEHCRTCEYGELCRRSHEFGEEVDPFEPDEFSA